MPKFALHKALLPKAQSTKRLIHDFADRSGMVYFGFVSQRNDDHHIVRGLTVSTKHVDDHYCIGTFDNYDVVFVERADTLRSGKRHTWHILEIDLKTQEDLPHIFIGSQQKGKGFHELLELKFPTLQPFTPGATGEYPARFTQRFGMYATPAHAVSAEQVITPAIAATISDHFSGLVVEVSGTSLYIYSEHSGLTSALLDTMLKNGTWLAAAIDKNNRHV